MGKSHRPLTLQHQIASNAAALLVRVNGVCKRGMHPLLRGVRAIC